MADLIDRQAAINALEDKYFSFGIYREQRAASQCIDAIKNLPSAQPERHFDEWCTDCKEYDQEKNCCPRFNRMIRTAMTERKKGRWILHGAPPWYVRECSVCGGKWHHWSGYDMPKYCGDCGARMEVQDVTST